MKLMNKTEKLVAEMLERDEKLHGMAREIAIEMAQRELVYPCDLDPMGECPKRVMDCRNCHGEKI